MSHAATNWAIKQRGLKPAAKIVLWHLCDRYNPDNGCFVSQERLAKDCEMSRSALNHWLDVLEEARLIRRKQNRNEQTKRQERTEYYFPFEDGEHAANEIGKPSPESRHGSESGKSPEPSPDFAESRVRNPDTNFVREPVREPVNLERDTREREDRKSPIAFIPPDEEAQAVEAVLTEMLKHWPPGAVGSLAKARSLLHDMTSEARTKARDATPRYLRALKDEKRGYVPAISTFLGERDFERFPEPVKAAVEPSVELKPYTTELYALLWRSVADAVAGKGSPARVRNRLDWLARGMTTPASGLPAHDDVRTLRPVTIGSERFARWMIFCERVGIARFPVPDAVPVILVPSDEPPPLKLAWKGYHLALPVSIEVRGREWWWRLYCDGAPVEDLLRDRSHGRVSLDLGPVPTRAEADAMIEIDIASDAFAKWEIWFAGKGARLLALSGSVFVPTENPPEMQRAEAPDYEALEGVFP